MATHGRAAPQKSRGGKPQQSKGKLPQQVEEWQKDGSLNLLGAFTAEVRCIEVVESVVWTAEKEGTITMRKMNGVSAGCLARDPENPLVTALKWSPAFDRVWIGYSTGLVRVVSPSAVRDTLMEEREHKNTITTITERAGKVYTGSVDFYIGVWCASSLTFLRALRYGSGVKALCTSDELLVCGGYDGSIKLWKIDESDSPSTLGTHRNSAGQSETVNDMLLSSESRDMLWSAGDDKAVRVWDTVSRKQVKVISDFTAAAKGLLDLGRIILVHDGKGVLQSFNSRTFEPFARYHQARGVILSMSYTATHLVHRVWTADADGRVRVWLNEVRGTDNSVLDLAEIRSTLETTYKGQLERLEAERSQRDQARLEEESWKLEELRREKAKLLDAEEKRHGEARELIADLQGERDALMRDLEERDGRIAELEHALETAVPHHLTEGSDANTVQNLKEQLVTVEANAQEARDALDMLQMESTQAAEDLREAQHHAHVLEDQVRELEELNHHQSGVIAQYSAEIESLRAEARNRGTDVTPQEEVLIIREQAREWEERYRQLEEEMGEVLARAQAQADGGGAAEVQQLQHELFEMTAAHRQAVAEVEKLQGELRIERELREATEQRQHQKDMGTAEKQRVRELELEVQVMEEVLEEQKRRLEEQGRMLSERPRALHWDPAAQNSSNAALQQQVAELTQRAAELAEENRQQKDALTLHVQDLGLKAEAIALQEESLIRHRELAEQHMATINDLTQRLLEKEAMTKDLLMRTQNEAGDERKDNTPRDETLRITAAYEEAKAVLVDKHEAEERKLQKAIADLEQDLEGMEEENARLEDELRAVRDELHQTQAARQAREVYDDGASEMTDTIPMDYDGARAELVAAKRRIHLQKQVLQQKSGQMKLLEELLRTKEGLVEDLDRELQEKDEELKRYQQAAGASQRSSPQPQQQQQQQHQQQQQPFQEVPSAARRDTPSPQLQRSEAAASPAQPRDVTPTPSSEAQKGIVAVTGACGVGYVNEDILELQAILRDKDELLGALKDQLGKLIEEKEQLTREKAAIREQVLLDQRVAAELTQKSPERRVDPTRQDLERRIKELEEHLMEANETTSQGAGAVAQLDVLKGVFNEMTQRLEIKEQHIHELSLRTIQLEKQVKDAEALVVHSQEQVGLLNTEAERLRVIAEAKAESAALERDGAVADAEECRAKIDLLAAQLDEAMSTMQRIEHENQSLRELASERQYLLDMLKEEMTEERARWQREKDTRNLERSELIGEIEELRARVKCRDDSLRQASEQMKGERNSHEEVHVTHAAEVATLRKELHDVKCEAVLLMGQVEDERRLRKADKERYGLIGVKREGATLVALEELQRENSMLKHEVTELKISKNLLLDQVHAMQDEEKERKLKREREVLDLNAILESTAEQKALLAKHTEAQEVELDRLNRALEDKERERQAERASAQQRETELMRKHDVEVEKLRTRIVKQSTELAAMQADLQRAAHQTRSTAFELQQRRTLETDLARETGRAQNKTQDRIDELETELRDAAHRIQRMEGDLAAAERERDALQHRNEELHKLAGARRSIASDEDELVARQRRKLEEKDQEITLLHELVDELNIRVRKLQEERDMTVPDNDLLRRLRTVEEERDMLKSRVSAVTEHTGEDYRRLLKRCSELETQLESATTTEEVAWLRKRCASLEDQLQSVESLLTKPVKKKTVSIADSDGRRSLSPKTICNIAEELDYDNRILIEEHVRQSRLNEQYDAQLRDELERRRRGR